MELKYYTKLLLSSIVTLTLTSCGNNDIKNEDNNTTQEQINDNNNSQQNINEDAPIITLKGKNPLYLQHGRKYNEAGATAEDYVDGTMKVTISGKVDAFKVGTYYVNYTATDFEKHTTTVKRKVIVQPIIHHGVTYQPIVSKHTGQIWLDKDIGAKKPCINWHDESCTGDLFQWGRNIDGHEKQNSQITTKKGKTITDSGSKFVIDHSDWTTDKHRGENWKATDGRSICPAHYHVPSAKEFGAEVNMNFNKPNRPYSNEDQLVLDLMNDIKFSDSSYPRGRGNYNTEYKDVPYEGTLNTYWVTDVAKNNIHKSLAMEFGYIGQSLYSGFIKSFDRYTGLPVRCIQD